MPDDHVLRDHARDHGLRYRWQTRRKGPHWEAEVKLWEGERVIAWYGATTIEGEQRALDLAIAMALRPSGAGVDCGPINIMDQRQQGKGRR